MKPKKLTALILLFIFIAIATTFLFYFFFVIDTIRVIPMHIEVTQSKFGLNGDTDSLQFGKIAVSRQGVSAIKQIRLGNYKDHPSFVTVSFSGEMAPWTVVNITNFVLEPGQEKKLVFKATPPFGTEPGEYTGKARIVIKRYFG